MKCRVALSSVFGALSTAKMFCGYSRCPGSVTAVRTSADNARDRKDKPPFGEVLEAVLEALVSVGRVVRSEIFGVQAARGLSRSLQHLRC